MELERWAIEGVLIYMTWSDEELECDVTAVRRWAEDRSLQVLIWDLNIRGSWYGPFVSKELK